MKLAQKQPRQYTKRLINHVVHEHSDWMCTLQGLEWLHEINTLVDEGKHRGNSSSLKHEKMMGSQTSICPVCNAAIETIIDLTWLPQNKWHPLPLLVAVGYDDSERVQRLLQDPSILLQLDTGSIGDDRTPLYYAVRNGNADITNMLLMARADPHARIDRAPQKSNRPWIQTTPYQAAEGDIKDVFDEVLWPQGAPAPPPRASIPIQLQGGGTFWLRS